ncbi:Insulin-like growth factor binding protein, N-terminal [Pseudocohnilembus persalinus]|uniref:Insulin-like growth factor binding protein, N-terminal n=1 Tax=Pseudocohnilembus persalinus TaxID=266149 RepID=A0A0V0R639_PSEPJ|nr:Insulin-like growth factor binding protein, N-terminal [Pseudocohnilembus persalinus]|eukprot:KRX09950.1 Insulin-like growth factor binding protein, N-terminal [Pseudocohnilembus persalinus]
MSNKVNYLNYKIKTAFFCWIIGFFNPVQCIQQDTTQWQEVDITNNFINQNFVQSPLYSMLYDSLQLSQTAYANLIRSYDESASEILIQVLNGYGNQQCIRTIPVYYYCKYSLTNTNVQGELFFTYTSYTGTSREVFFGFLQENCNFSRGLSEPAQPNGFVTSNSLRLLAKTGKDNIYVVIQNQSSPYYLYLMIVDISDTSTYIIKNHVQLGATNFKFNLFSIQAFSDDYAVIFARDNNDKLQKITINSNGNGVWDTPQDQGIFLDLSFDYTFIQNKAIQIENTNKYCIITGDKELDIFTIYTFQYNNNGNIQDICLKSHYNQFGNVGNFFFYALEFGVISPDFIWIKGDNSNQNNKTVIFLANPLNCKIYRNPDDSSIYKYQLENMSYSHILHTYRIDQVVSLIVSSSQYDGNNYQNIQAIRISIGDNCPQYCIQCLDYQNCNSCVSANVLRNVVNQCLCPDKYFQDQFSNDCLECPQYCQTCSDSNTCQSCILTNGERDLANLCYCKDGYYQDGESGDCLKCPYYCQTCSNSSTCLTCIISDGERDLLNLCQCKDGQYQDKKSDNCLGIQLFRNILKLHLNQLVINLLECPQYCETCSDQIKCLSCISTEGQRNIKKQCTCLNGFYQDPFSNNCLECNQVCATCTDDKTCLTCVGDSVWDQNTQQCQCQQNLIQYYDKIGQCKSCIHFKFDYKFEGYWADGKCVENYYLLYIIEYLIGFCKIKLNQDFFYCRSEVDYKITNTVSYDGEYFGHIQVVPLALNGINISQHISEHYIFRFKGYFLLKLLNKLQVLKNLVIYKPLLKQKYDMVQIIK